MDKFNLFLDACGLIDIPINNHKLTWTNKRDDSILVNLDRFIFNSI